MNIRKIIQKRAISLVLAIMMAVSCTFNTAMADTGAVKDSKDSKDSNLLSLMAVTADATPTPVDITWKRSRETDQVAQYVANTSWTWSAAKNIQLGTTDPNTVWNANGHKAARWNYLTGASSSSSNRMDLRRFQGAFTIPEGFRRTDTVQFSSVNQDAYQALNGGKIIPINDDIFIFCYPKGTVLTDDNYLDYLAFWSGTSGPRDGRYGTNDGTTFHGLKGNQSHSTNASYNIIPYTDGWYVDADLDNIGASLFRNGTPAAGDDYIIDIFTQEYATNGGMDKPQITFTHSNDYRVQAQNDSYQATSGTPADLDILNNDKVYFADTDVTDQVALEVDINSLVSSTEGITLDKTSDGNYSVLQDGTAIGDLTVNDDGTGTFTPDAGFTGNIKFKYTATCTQNGKKYTADAYVTISVKNLNLSKTALYTGNFNSATGTGTRSYQLSLSASVTQMGDTFEQCAKPYSDLPDGTYYLDEEGTTAVTKTTEITPTTYNWFRNGSPISLTNLYIKTSRTVTDYSEVSYNVVKNNADRGWAHSILKSDGTHVPVRYQQTYSSDFNNHATVWVGINDGYHYYYDNNGAIWCNSSGDQYKRHNGTPDGEMVATRLTGSAFQRERTRTENDYTSVPVNTVPVIGTEYCAENSSGGYDRVTWTVTNPTTRVVWRDADNHLISTPAGDLYQLVSNNAPITGATVQDTVDPRFLVLDDDNHPITDTSDTVTLANGGVVSYDDGDGVWKVVWDDETIPVANAQWAKTIHVTAKPAFFGGNDIPTNVRADSCVSFRNEEDEEVKIPFDQPTVNVPIYLPQTNQAKAIFLGEEVGPLPANMTVDVAAFNNPDSAMWCGKGQTGTISANWYYDENCTNPADGADPAVIAARTPSDTTPFYYKVTYTPNSSGSASSAIGGPAIGETTIKDIYTVNVTKGQLTITKAVTGGTVDSKQFFTFKVERFAKTNAACTGTALSTTYEVINGAGSKTVVNLPLGNYKVTEISGSAWRYSRQGNTQYSLGQYLGRNPNNSFTSEIQATVTNQLTNNKWISSQDSVTNVFPAVEPD